MEDKERHAQLYLQPARSTQSFAQLLLRLALGAGFILPVLDRLGMLGAPGEPNVGWGNWENFTGYTHTLMPYINLSVASFFGFIATVAEAIFGIMLIIGYKTRLAALGSFGLTLVFAMSMLIFLGYRVPFNYSVFPVSFSSLLLAAYPDYQWSVDSLIGRRKRKEF